MNRVKYFNWNLCELCQAQVDIINSFYSKKMPIAIQLDAQQRTNR